MNSEEEQQQQHFISVGMGRLPVHHEEEGIEYSPTCSTTTTSSLQTGPQQQQQQQQLLQPPLVYYKNGDDDDNGPVVQQDNPQTGGNEGTTATTTTTSGGGGIKSSFVQPTSVRQRRSPTSSSSSTTKGKKDHLPPLFWYMEMGDWKKATERAKTHPKEVKSRATLRTKSLATTTTTAAGGGGGGGGTGSTFNTDYKDGKIITGTKRLALHHACFKLRSAGSAPINVIQNNNNNNKNQQQRQNKKQEDPFISVCKFILLLLEIFPEACQVRESRHGCLPLHLAAFASCYIRPPEDNNNNNHNHHENSSSNLSNGTQHISNVHNNNNNNNNNNSNQNPFRSKSSFPTNNNNNNNNGIIERPNIVSVRSTSESTTSTTHSNMTAILLEENFAATQTIRKKEGGDVPSAPLLMASTSTTPSAISPNATTGGGGDGGGGDGATNNTGIDVTAPTSSSSPPKQQPQNTIFISNKREQMAVKVLNAMLDCYPRAIRCDSEGGRLPLHTACAGRATPRCVNLLLRAYPAAARHRNKDGFLPLHLAAHWGVSHPNVAITLLKAYPDATVGRNRWERTPLEEALVMAGENGRPHQAPLVRALRKHPSYWTQPPKELFQAIGNGGGNNGHYGGNNVVDMDATLPSNDEDDETSMDDNPKYFNAGHTLLLEDEYENVPEGEETEIECDNNNNAAGGIISRLTRRRSNRNIIQNSPSTEITYNLQTLIKNLKWKSVIARLEMNPDEATEELVGVMTRGGFQSGAYMTPLHYACERKPPFDVVQALIEANPEAVTQRMMPGGCLPLHTALTWHSPPAVISALLSADPTTAKVVDELGNRPLHSACFSGAPYTVVQELLATYPKAVLSRNNQGSQPIDICRRLKHPNRRAVMTALLEKKDYIIAKQKHRRSKSSGSMGALAQSAVNMNDNHGNPSLSNPTTGLHPVRNSTSNDDDLPNVGVEVTYQDQGKSHTLLWI